ncbi:MAG: response regulator transcription factor [Clostridiales bacterium]|nr:response regulator transcription factor [Clostridiales bacterium]
MTYKILVVEDDFTIASELKTMMTGWGYEVKLTENFEDILGEFHAFQPHLILMDIGLPFANGFVRCSKIREESKVPVIFLSSASDNINLVTAINMGADDFVAKPFDFNVLTAKIMAVLRRAYDFAEEKSDVIEYRGASYNASDSTITISGIKVDLTKNENRIMSALLAAKGSIVSRNSLMQQLWDDDCFVDENTLSVNMNRLRKKLEAAGLADFIVTKKGQGYIIE